MGKGKSFSLIRPRLGTAPTNSHKRRYTPFCKLLHVLARNLHFLQTKQKLNAGYTGSLLKELFMYLLFVPPVLSFMAIFAITLRNQFADYTNL